MLAKVLYKSQNLCGNFCKARSPTYEAICIYALTGFSVPLFSNTHYGTQCPLAGDYSEYLNQSKIVPLTLHCSIELEQLHALEVFQDFSDEPFMLLLFVMLDMCECHRKALGG